MTAENFFAIGNSIASAETTIVYNLDHIYQHLLKILNQQNILIYIILALLGLVTSLVIVSIINQHKLKNELRQLRELLDQKEDKPNGEEDRNRN